MAIKNTCRPIGDMLKKIRMAFQKYMSIKLRGGGLNGYHTKIWGWLPSKMGNRHEKLAGGLINICASFKKI